MYRYRNHGGSTHRSIKAFKHLPKLGRILEVRGYTIISTRKSSEGNRYSVMRPFVMVKGENGSARFDGLLWGYKGEGPRGLATLLVTLGLFIDDAQALDFVSRQEWKNEVGIEFSIKIGNNGEHSAVAA